MFDVSFGEIALIGTVALVVLGPERLPKVARTAGHLFGRLQRYVATVKADINREMEMSDLAKVKEEVQSAAQSFESTMQGHASSIENEARALQVQAEKTIAETPAVAPPSEAPTQAELLASQEAGMHDKPDAIVTTTTRPNPTTVVETQQGAFDFGIEPSRKVTRT